MGTFATTSCSDELGESIFDTQVKALDRTSYTFPLDTFLVKNYQEPLNMQYLYKMRDISSDMDYNLVPCSYDKSIDFAVLCKYLWIDPYTKIYGKEEFLRQYAPRIIHLIGCPGYNPTDGTEKLGEAEGGKKITLMKGNELDPNDVDGLNEFFFKTMHHEFGHILHQNKLYPQTFRELSNGMYSPFNWQDTPDSLALSRGFISPYSANGVDDDWVEILCNYLVKDTITWNKMLRTAATDWEQVDAFPADTFNYCMENGVSRTILGSIDFTKNTPITTDADGNEVQYAIYRKAILRDDLGRVMIQGDKIQQEEEDDTTDGCGCCDDCIAKKEGTAAPVADRVTLFLGNGLTYEENQSYYDKVNKTYKKEFYQGRDGKGWTTRNVVDSSYVKIDDSMLIYTSADGIDGPARINQKLEMVREWLQKHFSINLEDLRKEIHSREYVTDMNGDFVFDEKGQFINRFTAPADKYPAVKAEIEKIAAEQSKLFGREVAPKATLIEQLRESVNQYKNIQNQ